MRQRPRRHGDENLPRGVQRIFHTIPESVIESFIVFRSHDVTGGDEDPLY
jgi:hypothetical protein